MTYRTVSHLAAHTPIATSDDTQRHTIGTIIQAADPTYGAGEFIYLKGVASTAVGSIVTYNSTTGVTTLAAAGAAKSFPLAVAMAATGASSWGWYQISGQAVCSKACTVCMVAGNAVGVQSTGVINNTASGKEVQGGIIMTTASAATGRVTVLVLINRPRLQGRIT